MLAAGRPAYVRGVQDFASGDPERMASSLIGFARSCAQGAAVVSVD